LLIARSDPGSSFSMSFCDGGAPAPADPVRGHRLLSIRLGPAFEDPMNLEENP
jgi:hypothetical protein